MFQIPPSRRRRRRRLPRNMFLPVLMGLGFMALAQGGGAFDAVAWRPTEPDGGGATTVTVRNGGNAWKGARPAARDTAPAAVAGGVLIDRVTRTRDGDTIVVGLIPIRIANLDCAEKGSRAGDRATRRAKELVAGETMTCQLEGRRSYDREVGVCALSDGRDFGEVLISEGYCSRWRG